MNLIIRHACLASTKVKTGKVRNASVVQTQTNGKNSSHVAKKNVRKEERINPRKMEKEATELGSQVNRMKPTLTVVRKQEPIY